MDKVKLTISDKPLTDFSQYKLNLFSSKTEPIEKPKVKSKGRNTYRRQMLKLRRTIG